MVLGEGYRLRTKMFEGGKTGESAMDIESTFFLLLQKESGQKEKGGRNRNPRD